MRGMWTRRPPCWRRFSALPSSLYTVARACMACMCVTSSGASWRIPWLGWSLTLSRVVLSLEARSERRRHCRTPKDKRNSGQSELQLPRSHRGMFAQYRLASFWLAMPPDRRPTPKLRWWQPQPLVSTETQLHHSGRRIGHSRRRPGRSIPKYCTVQRRPEWVTSSPGGCVSYYSGCQMLPTSAADWGRSPWSGGMMLVSHVAVRGSNPRGVGYFSKCHRRTFFYRCRF